MGIVTSQQLQQFPKVFVFTLISKEQHEIQVLPSVVPSKRNNSYFQGAARWQFHLDMQDQLSPAPVLKGRVLLWREQRSILRISALSPMTRRYVTFSMSLSIQDSAPASQLRTKTYLYHFTLIPCENAVAPYYSISLRGRWKLSSWLLFYGMGYSFTPEWPMQKGKWVQCNKCGEGLNLSSALSVLCGLPDLQLKPRHFS